MSPFAKEAYEKRKWAFAADYIRLFALYNYGGFFLILM
ncbi:glycosyltransferase sugar-binding region containing DXD motif family protein [Bacteroides fragilis str. 3397 N3]|nr:glycosyltransferase sugar-binding region containing DXD motif family protein [Bacteroides fragilis str. 3397 N3]